MKPGPARSSTILTDDVPAALIGRFTAVYAEARGDQIHSPQGREEMRDVAVTRFARALDWFVPWIDAHVPVAGSNVLELGCGTGSGSISLSLFGARKVIGIDIDSPSVKAAEARKEILGAQGVDFFCLPPADVLAFAEDRAAEADILVFFAVVEHLTFDERIDYLTRLYRALKPGAALVVIETPNRFAYTDRHTAEMPFFHLLPDEIARRYIDRVPRAGVREPMAFMRDDIPNFSLQRARWGLGVSFHEFEIAIPDPLIDIVIASGYEDQILGVFWPQLDESLLLEYWFRNNIAQPICFAREVLNFILRKPSGADPSVSREGEFRNMARRFAISCHVPPLSPLLETFPGRKTAIARLRRRLGAIIAGV